MTENVENPPPPPPDGPSDSVVYVERPGNGFAVAALVLGIIGVVVGLIPFLFVLTFILGALATIFGALGRGRATKQPNVPKKGMATAGLVLGIIALGLGVVGVLVVDEVVDDVNSDIEQIQEDFENDFGK